MRITIIITITPAIRETAVVLFFGGVAVLSGSGILTNVVEFSIGFVEVGVLLELSNASEGSRALELLSESYVVECFMELTVLFCTVGVVEGFVEIKVLFDGMYIVESFIVLFSVPLVVEQFV